jgi:hypothetical protein
VRSRPQNPGGSPTQETPTPRRAGETVVIRQYRYGRFRAVTPMVVVEDLPERVVLFVPRGTPFLAPADASGRITRRIADEAGVAPDHRRDTGALHIVPAGAPFAVIAQWRDSFDDFAGYYVNVQEPLRRTSIGFDSMDQALDVLISADLGEVHHKDVDELHDAAAAGFFGTAEVAAIHRAAEQAVTMVVEGQSPFDEPWSDWRPDPSWAIPALPPDWADVPLTPSPWATPTSSDEET